MFNNFLNSFNQRPYERQRGEFEKYMVNHITGKHDKISNPFHVDCPVTKQKVCYCKQSNEQLMDRKSREYQNAMARYLTDYYSGIQDNDYRIAFKNVQLHYEKVKYTQEMEDLNDTVPKFQVKQQILQEKLEKERLEKEKEEEARLQALQGLEQGYCYLCEKTHSFTFYDVIEKSKKFQLCHECCTQTRPNVIARKHLEDQLLHKRGKIPVHLKQLKDKLKQKRAMKNLQLEKCIENQKDEMESESEDELLCVNEYCEHEKEQKKMVCCKSCQRAWHANCLDPPLNYELVKRFDYFCTECKLCIICWKTGNEESLLMCDCCDRAYHIECMNPPMLQIPDDKWFCDDCVRCASCRNVLLTNENFNNKVQEKYAQQTIDHKIICDKCWVYYQKKEYCPVCYKVVENDAEGSYVWCDDCSLWIHFKCEKLNQKQIQQVQSLSSYTCKNCKQIKDKEEAIKNLNERLVNDKSIGDINKNLNIQIQQATVNNEKNISTANNLNSNINSTNDINRKRTSNYKYYDDLSDSQEEDDAGDDDEDYRG